MQQCLKIYVVIARMKLKYAADVLQTYKRKQYIWVLYIFVKFLIKILANVIEYLPHKNLEEKDQIFLQQLKLMDDLI